MLTPIVLAMGVRQLCSRSCCNLKRKRRCNIIGHLVRVHAPHSLAASPHDTTLRRYAALTRPRTFSAAHVIPLDAVVLTSLLLSRMVSRVKAHRIDVARRIWTAR